MVQIYYEESEVAQKHGKNLGDIHLPLILISSLGFKILSQIFAKMLLSSYVRKDLSVLAITLSRND